jgi:hypothetical protein
MKLAITNTSASTVDIAIGSLPAGGTVAIELDPSKYYRLMARIKTLVDDNTLKIQYLKDTSIAAGHDIPSAYKLHVSVKDFGAVGDGATDDTKAIQAAIDFALYQNGPGNKIYMSPGIYKTSDTLHLGYGTSFSSGILEGDGYLYAAFSSVPAGGIFSGVAITPTFSDRPVINVQGARGSVIRGIAIVGRLTAWIDSNQFTDISGASIDDTDAANWDDPTLAATADSRYAPYAAITIDAYSGAPPAQRYPNVTYPAFLGTVAQYSKAFSSDVLIENCYISGVTVGIANQPSDADGNGDFTVVRRCNFEKVKWGISVCNSQSRNVAIENVKMGTLYCALTNCRHGRRAGKFNGAVINLSLGQCIQVFDFGGTSITGPIEFTNLYCEALWRIGDVTLPTAAETSLRFRECLFSFECQLPDSRGVPALLIGPMSGDLVDFAFTGCTFNNFRGVASLGQYPHFDGCMFFSNEYATTEASSIPAPYRRYALNFLTGGVATPRFDHADREQKIKFTQVALSTGNRQNNVQTSDAYKSGTREYCIPNCVRSVRPSNDAWRNSVPTPQWNGTAFDKANLSGGTLVDRTLTLTFPSLSDYYASIYGFSPGDVIWDADSGTVFFIRSRAANIVVAEQQNNFRNTGSGWTNVTSINLHSGYIYAANTRIYTTEYSLLGTITQGSDIVTDCGRADGYAGFLSTSLAVDDWVWVDDMRDLPFPVGGQNIVAIDGSAKTVTLSTGGVGANYSQTRRTFSFFIRQAPSNRGSR